MPRYRGGRSDVGRISGKALQRIGRSNSALLIHGDEGHAGKGATGSSAGAAPYDGQQSRSGVIAGGGTKAVELCIPAGLVEIDLRPRGAGKGSIDIEVASRVGGDVKVGAVTGRNSWRAGQQRGRGIGAGSRNAGATIAGGAGRVQIDVASTERLLAAVDDALDVHGRRSSRVGYVPEVR